MILAYRLSNPSQTGKKCDFLRIVCKGMAVVVQCRINLSLLDVSFTKSITNTQQRLELFVRFEEDTQQTPFFQSSLSFNLIFLYCYDCQ